MGHCAPGSSFDWSSYGFDVTSQIYEVGNRSRTLWGGTAEGITGIHEWLFAETDGSVRVTTTESFAGDPVSADAAGIKVSSMHHSWPGSTTSGQPPREASECPFAWGRTAALNPTDTLTATEKVKPGKRTVPRRRSRIPAAGGSARR
jgi:hypothetical protein